MWGILKSVSELLLCRSAVKMTHYRVTEVADCTKNLYTKEWTSRLRSWIIILCDFVNEESSVFQFAIQKLKQQDVKNYYSACCFGCKTWSLTLREECTLRVFENSVLRRIFVPRRD